MPSTKTANNAATLIRLVDVPSEIEKRIGLKLNLKTARAHIPKRKIGGRLYVTTKAIDAFCRGVEA